MTKRESTNPNSRGVEKAPKKGRLFRAGDPRDFEVVWMKKAVIIVKLVPESSDVSDGQIVKEIIAEAKIPWAAKIESKRQRKCLNS